MKNNHNTHWRFNSSQSTSIITATDKYQWYKPKQKYTITIK